MEECSNFFYHHICHRCKLKSPIIKKCSGCKLVSYCSKRHQQEDWRYHKVLCKSIQDYLQELKITNLFGLASDNAEQWRTDCLYIICAIELKTKRPLKLYEKQQFLFPNLCPVCYIFCSNFKYMCNICNYTCYCSLEHKSLHFNKHSGDCASFQLCYEVDRLCFDSKLDPVDVPISQCDGTEFPNNMDDFLSTLGKSYNEVSKAILSEHVSGVLSLLYAIKTSTELSEKSELVIHAIGVSVYEQSVLMTVELLFHYLPLLRKLILVLIGPDVCDNYLEPVLCANCNESVKFILVREKFFYQDYIISNSFLHPNVIFSFNCGFSEYLNLSRDTWQEAIKIIWNFNVLFGFTSYTATESTSDVSVVIGLKPKGKDCILERVSGFNPFKSMRPYRNWVDSDGVIFYNNSYITILNF